MLVQGPKCHSRGITGFGDFTPGGVCFVGIAPGEHEQFTSKRPLTGPSGQLLDSILEACGPAALPREQTYATNLLCWWNNSPSLSEILDCWPRLQSELSLLQPKLIIPLGEIATDFLLGNIPSNTLTHSPSDWLIFSKNHPNIWPPGEEYPGFASRRGRTSWSSALNAYVMPTYHTAAVLRSGPYFISDIVRALSKISLVLKEFLPNGKEASYDYRVVKSVEEGNRVLQSLPRSSKGVALDIETNYGRQDIDWFSEDLLCLSLTSGWNDTWVIPGHLAKSLNWGLAEGVHWIGQNFIFDSNGVFRWCSNEHGIADLPIKEDTMYQSYVLDERPGRHDLELLGGEWCAAPYWKSYLSRFDVKRTIVNEKGRKVQRKFREVPLDVLYKYNAGDTTYTYRIHSRQRPVVTSDGMERVYTQLLVPAANAFKEIQYRGMYIDQARQSELMIEWCEMWLEQEANLQLMAHEADPTLTRNLNFKSSQQMLRFLYDTLQLPPQYTKSTKTTEPPRLTANKNALEVLAQYHPFCEKLQDWRQVQHMMQVSEGITTRIKIDEMLHAQPQIHGTETGRLSYHDPNLQNIAQDWNVGANLARIREIFAPANPETHFIAEFDYKQIELWMAQMWSQDQAMLADLMTGDFHRMTVAKKTGKAWDEVTEGDRFFAKIVTFGRLYERGAEDMTKIRAGALRFTLEEANQWIRDWNEIYHQYIEWAASLKQQAIEEGVIVTPWGRKRRYYLVMGEEAHHQLRSALNFCMQSTAHDYTLTALILLQLQHKINQYDSYILVEGHDALLCEISIKYAPEVVPLIIQTMQSVRPNLDWPTLSVDYKTGPNWGQCRKACKGCHLAYPDTTFTSDSGKCTTCEKVLATAA